MTRFRSGELSFTLTNIYLWVTFHVFDHYLLVHYAVEAFEIFMGSSGYKDVRSSKLLKPILFLRYVLDSTKLVCWSELTCWYVNRLQINFSSQYEHAFKDFIMFLFEKTTYFWSHLIIVLKTEFYSLGNSTCFLSFLLLFQYYRTSEFYLLPLIFFFLTFWTYHELLKLENFSQVLNTKWYFWSRMKRKCMKSFKLLCS